MMESDVIMCPTTTTLYYSKARIKAGIKVEKGRAVKIAGAEEVEVLRKMLEESGNPNVYTIAEFISGLVHFPVF